MGAASGLSRDVFWAAAAVVQVGEMLRVDFHDIGHGKFQQKPDGSWVADTDRKIDAELHRLIAKEFPEDGRMGEESDASEPHAGPRPRRTWIFDSVDGTKVGLRWNVPVPCISLARADHGDPTVGVMYNPISGVLVVTEQRRGTYRWSIPANGNTVPRDRLIGARRPAAPLAGMIPTLAAASWTQLCFGDRENRDATGFAYFVNGHDDDALTIRITSLVQEGGGWAARLDATVQAGVCLLTSDDIGGVVLPRGGPWDMAALVLAVREAGGCAEVYRGAALEAPVARLDTRGDVGGIFAANAMAFRFLETAASRARSGAYDS